MPLRISVVPASTQAGKQTISELLQDENGPIVHGIYRNPSKAPSEFLSNSNFQAVKGNISSESDLDFNGADVVFYILPPVYDGTPSTKFATENANNVKTALQKSSSVRRLLVFSAVGAQYEESIGILAINHITDQILKDSVPEVVIAKGSWFMENWASAFETLKSDLPHVESFITPLDYKIAMISLVDIGKICAEHLLTTGKQLSSNPYVFDLHGPQSYSANDVRVALIKATGRDFALRGIYPDQLLDFYSRHVNTLYAHELAEMTTAMLPGGLIATEMEKTDGIVRGTTSLEHALGNIVSGKTEKVKSGAF